MVVLVRLVVVDDRPRLIVHLLALLLHTLEESFNHGLVFGLELFDHEHQLIVKAVDQSFLLVRELVLLGCPYYELKPVHIGQRGIIKRVDLREDHLHAL